MKKIFFWIPVCLQVAAYAFCLPASETSSRAEGFVDVNGVKLNYLDWPGPKGASRPPLVLIHGFADSPHLFDDLAPKFQDLCRVIGYARRGHGLSEAPSGPYDNQTLVEDLRQLLDRLHVRRVNLLGHSLGGNEITKFAGLYPERVDRVVYLEAGYDWSDQTFTTLMSWCPVATAAKGHVLASLDAYRTWYKGIWFPDVEWTPGLETYLREIIRMDSNGRVKEVPGPEVRSSLWASTLNYRRDYSKVLAPALALYATNYFSSAAVEPDQAQRLIAWEQKMEQWRQASIDRLREELPGATIVRIPETSHSSIIMADAVVAEIRQFLEEKP